MTTTGTPSSGESLDCDLCIVGAGYAALNGLNAAAKYLRKGERVVVIDEKEDWGGQWLHQYDFVRLHQPYRMFTAGDQPWTLRRDPSHLATRREVLDHLRSVPEVSASHLEITPLFRHSYLGHRVHEGRVIVDATPISKLGGAQSGRVRVRARRLLRATGTDIEILRPFPLSSKRVRSVAVADPVLTSREFLDSSAPVFVIGSGKTAMDCVRQVAQAGADPRRMVNIVIGSGMWFFARDNLYPSGRRRYLEGTLTGDLFLLLAKGFDGHNEEAVMRDLERRGLALNVFGHAGNCRYGILSYAERDEIRRSVGEVYRGHLVDVDETTMVLREGGALREVSVPQGSWFINCMSHFRHIPHQAVLQDSGLVCAPQFALGFTGTTAYFLTHLWYRDQLATVAPELFRVRIDVEPKLRLAPQMGLMVMANLAMVSARLPFSVSARFQGDFNKWYPLPRQLPTLAHIIGSRSEVVSRAERVLRMRFSDSPDPE